MMEEEDRAPNSRAVLGQPLDLFGSATTHLVSEVTSGSWRLLFARVELLPLEIPAPLPEEPIAGPRVNKRQTRVFSHHVSTSVETALAWFEFARRGHAVPRPEPDGRLLTNGEAAVAISANAWLEEPDWPNWVILAPDFPVISGWHANSTRAHHLIARDFEWTYTPEDSKRLDEFLECQVGFRRTEWPQLAGSVHLLVPNPYIRTLSESLNSSRVPEALTIAVVPRHGVQPPPMQLEVVEHRPTGVGFSRQVAASSGEQQVPMYGEIVQASTILRNMSSGEVEVHSAAGHFMRQAALTMDVSSHTRKIDVRGLDGAVLEELEISVAQPGVASVSGEAAGDAVGILEHMTVERRIRASASELEQRWVSGDPEAAKTQVREWIGRAREQVMIIDPYLGWVDIQRYAFATRLAGVQVRLLSSRQAFTSTEAGAGTSPVALERELTAALARDSRLGEIDVRVMSVSELHDRFLRVDSRLYALGNSLNSLGTRAGLMMRIPDPRPVFEQLEEIWGRAQPLAQYAQDWLKSRPEEDA